MSRIFLGKPLHWAIIVGLVAAGWVTGRQRLHVTDFNLFVICLLLVAAVAVLVVLRTSKPGERVTRDPLELGDKDA